VGCFNWKSKIGNAERQMESSYLKAIVVELASGPPPTQLLIPSCLWGGEQEEQEEESSWAEIKTERSPTSYCHRQNSLNLGKINFLPIYIYIYMSLLIWVLRRKTEKSTKTLRETTLLLLLQARLCSRPLSCSLVATAAYTPSLQ